MVGRLFLTALATGLAAALAGVRPADIGARFVRFYAGWAAALFLAAEVLHAAIGDAGPPGPTIAAGVGLLAGLAAAGFFSAGWNASARVALVTSAAAGAAALALIAVDAVPMTAGSLGIAAAAVSWWTSAAVLGYLTNAMLVGHQFLQQPNLPLRVLQAQTMGLIAALAARAAAAGGAAALFWPTVIEKIGPIDEWISSVPGFTMLVRFVVGLVAPLGFSYLVRETVRIRSTQSATGILYGILIFVFLGELTAFLIFRAHGLPV